MNPHHFLVGCLRSGTTLLMRIVRAHPELAVIDETQWIPQWYERRVGLTSDGMVTSELMARLPQHKRFSRLELGAGEIAALLDDGAPRPYARFVSELFDLYAAQKGKLLAGEKSPGYVRHLGTLHGLWPDARIVHLIRDGRDVALSVLDWKKHHKTAGSFSTSDEDEIMTAALWWEWHIRAGRESARHINPERYHELRYESLVADPEGETARLSDFLGVRFDSAMLRFHAGRTRPGLRKGSKAAWLPVTAGLRDWRQQLSPDALDRFEAVAGSLLDELGYERSRSHISAARVDTAARLRSAFSDDLRERGRPVPEAWKGTAA